MAAGIAIGAFGAHGLKSLLMDRGTTEAFKTGVLYHLVHALAILSTGLSPFHREPSKKAVFLLFLAGLFCFSGSLYLLSTFSWGWLGPITPIGGIFFICGWIYAAFSAKKPN